MFEPGSRLAPHRLASVARHGVVSGAAQDLRLDAGSAPVHAFGEASAVGLIPAAAARMTQSTTGDGRPRVLVVGAGPVGLVAAIRLREQGIDVRVVDALSAGDKHMYPVVLHPRTLRILSALGVTASLEWRGRAVTQLVVYADGQRRVVLELPGAGQVSPGAMTLPQDLLRQALMQRLANLGVDVEWKTRLTALEQDPARVRLTLTRRERVEGRPSQLKPEWIDVVNASLDVDLVIAADGRCSTVRDLLGISMVQRGKREMYAFYDAPDVEAAGNAHLVFSDGTANSVYPLQGEFSRLSFQVGVDAEQPPGQAQLRQLLASRMPWYARDVEGFEWSGSAVFYPSLAERFGEGRVWLAGDAAHSTGPLGGQSLNVGMHEAHDLALRMAELVDRPSVGRMGHDYGAQCRLQWQQLFGLGSSMPNVARAPEWVKRNISMLLPSLPAAGDDLDDLLDQLRIRSA
jgi:NADPH-dependent dioxygenase